MQIRLRNASVALLLAFSLFLCFCVTACTRAGEGDASEETSGGDVTETPAESSEPNETSGGGTDTMEGFTYRTNIALQKPYTGPETIGSYPDTYHSELTDGLTYSDSGLTYMDPCWSDYGQPDPVEFTIDLGSVQDRIYAFGLSYLVEIGPGIGAPQSVKVSYSEDGEKFHYAASIKTESADGWYLGTADLKKAISARYIRFSMNHYAANLFLDELCVYADVPPQDDTTAVRELVALAYSADNYAYGAALAKLAAGRADAAAPKQVFSKGAGYTVSRNAGQKHPESGRQLTDGAATGASYESGAYVGYEGAEALEIVLTLSAETEASVFEAYLYCNAALGAVAPMYMDVAIESNGEFLTVGRVYAPETIQDGPCTYTLSLPVTVKAKKVRFSFPEQERSLLLIEEVTVGGYRAEEESKFVPFYSEKPIEKVTKDVFFPASGANKERVNLISGLTQRIFSFVPLAAGTFGNTAENGTQLTDGKYANTPSYTDGAYFKFGSGEGRDVVYDFGALAAVDGFSVSFLREDAVGINYIDYAMFYLSENGVDWYAVYAAPIPSSQASEFLRYDYELDQVYRARFARFSFRVWPNAYCDELQVWGKKDVSGAKSLSASGRKPVLMDQNAYAKRDTAMGGANDTVLLPNYSASDEKKNDPNAGFSVEDILPYVAYLDRNGKILDTMFDGFLFCPTGAALNGGHFYADTTMVEMQDMFDKTFTSGRDVDALEKAAEQTAAALGLSDYKVIYYVSIFYPGEGVTFGDLDGDGTTDKLDTFEKRMQAVRWQMDYILGLVNAGSYKHATFGGFYWINESLNAAMDEPDLLRNTSAEAKARGYGLFWIPYYKAPGFETWASVDFEIACMQPNMAFSATVGDEYVFYCATMAKRLGMCVEMELNDAATLVEERYFEKYMKYLLGGLTYGYMTETVHYYYQGVDIYGQACNAEDDRARLVYDYTYAFIKGELPKPEPVKTASFEGKKETMLSGTLGSGTNAETYTLAISPEHGTVTVQQDGSFVYYPEAGFTGTDHFSVVKGNYLFTSAPTEITVKIS